MISAIRTKYFHPSTMIRVAEIVIFYFVFFVTLIESIYLCYLGTTWAVLEYILMGFSIAAIFVNLFSLILSGTALQKQAKNFVNTNKSFRLFFKH